MYTTYQHRHGGGSSGGGGHCGVPLASLLVAFSLVIVLIVFLLPIQSIGGGGGMGRGSSHALIASMGGGGGGRRRRGEEGERGDFGGRIAFDGSHLLANTVAMDTTLSSVAARASSTVRSSAAKGIEVLAVGGIAADGSSPNAQQQRRRGQCDVSKIGRVLPPLPSLVARSNSPNSTPFFSQVFSPHIGYVEPQLIADTLRDLKRLAMRDVIAATATRGTREGTHGAVVSIELSPIHVLGDGGDGEGAPPLPHAAHSQHHHQRQQQLVLFAVDGTLLNLLRWGAVVNDNDIDLGFYFMDPHAHIVAGASPPSSSSSPPPQPLQAQSFAVNASAIHVMGQYYAMLDALAAYGIIHAPSPRDKKRLHSSTDPVRVGKCKHRGQLMQCRHKKTGVYIDLFGPDTLFSRLSRVDLFEDVLPMRPCRSFGFEFPCPRRPLKVLTSITLDLGRGRDSGGSSSSSSNGGDGRSLPHPPHLKDNNEFAGCPLFPRNATEQSMRHLGSILASEGALRECGYPTLLPLPSSSSSLITAEGTPTTAKAIASSLPPDCGAILQKALGV